MKTKRRHELQTNELADKLTRWIEQVRPYSKVIAGVVVVGAAAVFAIGFISGSQRRGLEKSWAAYHAAVSNRDADRLQLVARSHPGTKAASWALQAAAQLNLIEGSEALYRDRAAARTQLQEAEDGYQEAIEKATDELIRQRSLFGLAQAHEAQGELAEATQRYEEIAETWPESAIAEQASRRATTLSRADTKEFYRWFFAQQPPVRQTSDAGSPTVPFGDVPREPNVQMPQLSDLLSGPESGSDLEFPQPEDELPATEADDSADLDDDSSSAAEGAAADGAGETDAPGESKPIEVRTEPPSTDE